VAPLTLAPVLTEVNIVILVTREAIGVEFHLVRGLLVAAAACEFSVRAGQREASLLAVIEFPDAPAVGRVAFGALLAKRSLVDVIFPVAGDALLAGIPIFLREMTLLARHGYVQAQQWKAGQVMIEVHTRRPAFGRMTSVTSVAQAPYVNIAGTVTTRAFVR
jgi:hypothetical protein